MYLFIYMQNVSFSEERSWIQNPAIYNIHEHEAAAQSSWGANIQAALAFAAPLRYSSEENCQAASSTFRCKWCRCVFLMCELIVLPSITNCPDKFSVYSSASGRCAPIHIRCMSVDWPSPAVSKRNQKIQLNHLLDTILHIGSYLAP